MSKKEMLEVTADGKSEIVEGQEPLKKDPKKVKNRWKTLKKGLNNMQSIMDISAATQSEPQQPEEGEEEAGEEQQEEGGNEELSPEMLDEMQAKL
jgi:hypothetical protein